MATEGVFGASLDDDADGALRLLPDLAVMTFRDAGGGPLLPLWRLERGRRYELLITTEAGLVQYRIGDVIEVVDDAPCGSGSPGGRGRRSTWRRRSSRAARPCR